MSQIRVVKGHQRIEAGPFIIDINEHVYTSVAISLNHGEYDEELVSVDDYYVPGKDGHTAEQSDAIVATIYSRVEVGHDSSMSRLAHHSGTIRNEGDDPVSITDVECVGHGRQP